MLNENPLLISITCAVLQPSLRSLLILDAPFTGLLQAAQQLLAVAVAAGQKLRPVVLRATEEDDLWGERILPDGAGGLVSHRQLFSPPEQNDNEIPLLIIPDLSALHLAAARASLTLIGAPVAHLERHGQRGHWSPCYYWLASCPREEIGSVSPHLLDRFALRLSWHGTESLALSHQERLHLLRHNLQQHPIATISPLPPEDIQRIKQAAHYPPLVTLPDEVCDQFLSYFPRTPYRPRRELALAHCALALAQLAGTTRLQETHVSSAAALMGLHVVEPLKDVQTPPDSPSRPEEQPDRREEEERPSSTATSQTQAAPQTELPSQSVEVQVPEQKEWQMLEYIVTAPDPYPEDTQPILREANTLQIPHQYSAGLRTDRGPIIGVEPTTELRDLALVSTLLRALLFQAFRPNRLGTKIVLDWTDLRKYRRAAIPQRHLLLLLDYTCLPLEPRQHALIPYLSQAYQDRASITIIKVGCANETSNVQKGNLRAQSLSAHSILVPAISEAIDASAGQATPLAHGLELAFQTMQHLLQHGRSTVQHISFALITDGRGNVPLKVSHGSPLIRPTAREGVEDALKIAQEIGQIAHVSSVILSPELRYYKDLPQRLADALHAQFISLPAEEGEA